MIDYTKSHKLFADAKKLLDDKRLTFTYSNIATTGEVLNRWQVAYYKGIKFKVKDNIVRLEFSPHKYFEGGKTNYKDFTLKNIQDVIYELSVSFDFVPEKSFLNFFEIGVNIKNL